MNLDDDNFYRGQGQSVGDMPTKYLFRKMERSGVHEDRNAIYDEQRQALMDRSADRPWLEADQNLRNESFSRSQIHMRATGRRGGTAEPYLPDGTLNIIDQIDGFTHDPRAYNTDVPMDKLKEQNAYRTRYIKFTDSSVATPESNRNPAQLQRDEIAARRRFKQSFRNFKNSRSMVNRSVKHQSEVDNVGMAPVSFTQEVHETREGYIGHGTHPHVREDSWRTEQELEFKASTYGLPYKTAHATLSQHNKRTTEQDQDLPLSTQFSGMRNKQAAKQMVEHIMQHHEHDTDFKTSSLFKNRSTKAQGFQGNTNFESIDDRAMEIIRLMDGAIKNRSYRAATAPEDSRVNQTIIDQKVINFLDAANRTNTGSFPELVLKNAITEDRFRNPWEDTNTGSNRKTGQANTMNIAQTTLSTQFLGSSKTPVMYSGSHKKLSNRQRGANYEEYAAASSEAKQYAASRSDIAMDIGAHAVDNSFHESAVEFAAVATNHKKDIGRLYARDEEGADPDVITESFSSIRRYS
jgi:hypothetical protein